MLRRDTLRIIDGAGPSIEVPPSEATAEERVSETKTEHASSPGNQPDDLAQARTSRTDMVEQVPSTQNEHATSRDVVEDQKQPTKTTKCTFSGVIPIELQRFLDSGIRLVECPNCAATRSLEPHRGVLRFSSHSQRKTRTPNIGQRWVKRETAWEVAGR
jgi:hypothetical protein